MELRIRTIAEAWPKIIKRIIELGDIQEVIVDGEYIDTLEYPEPIMVRIGDPLNDMIPKGSGWSKQTLDIYANQLIDANQRGFVYTYGQRLRNYKGIDQIGYIIRRLRQDPTSRQALAITWKPEEDPTNEYPPCLQIIDVKLRKNKLHMSVYFRSNDMWSAWPQNAYALASTLRYLSRIIGVETGTLTMVSNAAHVYDYDWKAACELVGLDYMLLTEVNISTNDYQG